MRIPEQFLGVLPGWLVILLLILTILVSAGSTAVTLWLSARRFYREKWWEAKMQAYSEIIQAIHHAKWDTEISIKAEIEGRDTDSEYYKKWGERHVLAWEELRKQTDIGEFLFSSESAHLLRDFLAAAKYEGEIYIEHLETVQEAIEKYLPQIKKSAREDLGLPPIA